MMSKPMTDEESDLIFQGYEDKSAEDRLRVLQTCWERADNDEQRNFLSGRMLEATVGMEEHPEWFEHGCLCQECMTCG
jgi:hypothetical protein